MAHDNTATRERKSLELRIWIHPIKMIEIFAESRCFQNIICQQVIAKCHLIFRMISKSHVLIVIKLNFEK